VPQRAVRGGQSADANPHAAPDDHRDARFDACPDGQPDARAADRDADPGASDADAYGRAPHSHSDRRADAHADAAHDDDTRPDSEAVRRRRMAPAAALGAARPTRCRCIRARAAFRT
jgi:hypothetical protein